MGFGIGSKKSSSSSSSKVRSEVNTQNSGFSEIEGPAINVQSQKSAKVKVYRRDVKMDGNQAAMVSGTGNTVNYSDAGAIKGAFDFAETVNAQMNTVNQGVVKDAIKAVSESRKTESENVSGSAIQWLGYAALAFAGAWAIRGFKHG